MASDADEELRVKAYQLVARAEGDPEFARMVRADPGAVLREVGISEDVLTAGVAGQKASALPERWGCNDFTCWSSACPGTCYVTFCHTTYYRD